jgi:hypothetical protein
MCGLIAWIGEVPEDIDELCNLTGGRGPHQHGWAILEDFVTLEKFVGPIKPISHGDYVVGHSRLATSGSHAGTLPPIIEAQPYLRDNLVIAHNGIIYLDENKEYLPEVDTLMLYDVEDPHEFLRFHHQEYGCNHALITATPESMRVGSYGHPLWIRETEETMTVTSVPNDVGEWERVFDEIEFHLTPHTKVTPA